ncbi:hypothetical protein BTW01_08310 [Bacillus sp. SKDU12]|nr:hypothetical protein BTW01_08310 [Bacillus sp. SKDU12]
MIIVTFTIDEVLLSSMMDLQIDLALAGRSVLSGITLLGLPFLAFAYRQMKGEMTKHRSALEKPL